MRLSRGRIYLRLDIEERVSLFALVPEVGLARRKRARETVYKSFRNICINL